MGVVENISADKFPKQSKWLGKKVNVSFNYDTKNLINGVIVRDDAEDPCITMIQLENGRIVLATECQYQMITPKRLGTDIKPVEYWEEYIQQPGIPDEEFKSFEDLYDILFEALEDWDQDSEEGLEPEIRNKVAYHFTVHYHSGGRINSDVVNAMITQL